MKVLYIFSLLQDLARTPRAYKEILTLAHNGYDVTVLSFNGRSEVIGSIGNIGFKLPNTKAKNQSSPVPYLIAKFFLIFLNMILFSLPVLYYGLKLKPDFYFCYGFNPWNLPLPLIKNITRKKLIIDWPEDYFTTRRFTTLSHSSIKQCLAKLVNKVISYSLTYFVRDASFVFVIPQCEKQLSRFNKKIYALWNYPEFDQYKAKGNLRKEKTILYVGNISKRNGIMEIVKAMNIVQHHLPEAKLLIIGPSEDNTKINMLSYICKNSLEENVKFLEPAPYTGLVKFLQDARVGLCTPLPWDKIQFEAPGSTKLFLYMKYSLPIVASNFPKVHKLIYENRCGITVNPTKLGEIGKAIVYLLQNPADAEKMGREGRKAFETKYNWRSEEQKILKALNSIRNR